MGEHAGSHQVSEHRDPVRDAPFEFSPTCATDRPSAGEHGCAALRSAGHLSYLDVDARFSRLYAIDAIIDVCRTFRNMRWGSADAQVPR